jgi:hypothetical protein
VPVPRAMVRNWLTVEDEMESRIPEVEVERSRNWGGWKRLDVRGNRGTGRHGTGRPISYFPY